MSISPTTARYWDRAAVTWQAGDHHALWRSHCDAVNLELLRAWLPAGRIGRVLKTDVFDESSGPGLFSHLMQCADHVVGMDISFVTVDTARSRYPRAEFATTDVRRLPFANDAFDCIVSNSTLDHFDSQREIAGALHELCRILRPGGKLLLTLDNRSNPFVFLRNALPYRMLNRLGIVPYYVGAACGPRRLNAYVRDAGMSVLEETAILHCPRVAAVAAARYLDRRGSSRIKMKFLQFLQNFERLEQWPIRYFSGYFVALLAGKP